MDWVDICGQYQAKRALEIAAAGGHDVLLAGPPGSGKTLLAKAYPGTLPPLSEQESMEVTRLYSAVGLLKMNGQLMVERHFRHPHYRNFDRHSGRGKGTPARRTEPGQPWGFVFE